MLGEDRTLSQQRTYNRCRFIKIRPYADTVLGTATASLLFTVSING
jgi:hypothetical protein